MRDLGDWKGAWVGGWWMAGCLSGWLVGWLALCPGILSSLSKPSLDSPLPSHMCTCRLPCGCALAFAGTGTGPSMSHYSRMLCKRFLVCTPACRLRTRQGMPLCRVKRKWAPTRQPKPQGGRDRTLPRLLPRDRLYAVLLARHRTVGEQLRNPAVLAKRIFRRLIS